MNWKVVFAGLAFAVMTPGPKAGDGTKVGLASLDEIRSFPSAYLQVAFQLDVLYNGTGEVYNPFYTVFEPSGWYNFSAWGADTPVWEKEQYKHPHRYFYVDRSNHAAFQAISTVSQRSWLRVTCRVRSTFHDQPWIEVLSVDEVGKTLDRNTLAKLVRGWTYAEQGEFERAVVEMESANLTRMPRPFVAMQRMEFARCAMRAGDLETARNALAQARSLDKSIDGLETMTATLESYQRDPTLARADRKPVSTAKRSDEEGPSVLIPYRDLGGGPAAVVPDSSAQSVPTETVEWSPTTGSETETEESTTTDPSDAELGWTAPPTTEGVEIEIEVPEQPATDAPTTEDPSDSVESTGEPGSVQGEMTILEDTGPEQVLDIEWPTELGTDESSASEPDTSVGDATSTVEFPGTESVTDGESTELEVPAIVGLETEESTDSELLELIELSPLPFETEAVDTGSVASVDGAGSSEQGSESSDETKKSDESVKTSGESKPVPETSTKDGAEPAKSESVPSTPPVSSGWDTVPPTPPKSGSEVPPPAAEAGSQTKNEAGKDSGSSTQEKKEVGD